MRAVLCRSHLVCLSSQCTLRRGPGLHADSRLGSICSRNDPCRPRGAPAPGQRPLRRPPPWVPEGCGISGAGGRGVQGTWGRPAPGASCAFSLSPRCEPPPDYHVCSLDSRPLPRWVRAPHRPLPRRRAGRRWSQPSRCPLSAGVCLLLPEPAGSEGAGELRVPGSGERGLVQAAGGAEGQQVAARSDRAPGPRPGGAAPCIPAACAPAHPHLPREEPLGSDGDIPPTARRRNPPSTLTSPELAGRRRQAVFVEPRRGARWSREFPAFEVGGSLPAGLQTVGAAREACVVVPPVCPLAVFLGVTPIRSSIYGRVSYSTEFKKSLFHV